MKIRWLVLAGAILAIQAPALDYLSLTQLRPIRTGIPRVWSLTLPVAAYFVTALVLLAMAFGRLRASRAARVACVGAFFVLAVLWAVVGSLYPRLPVSHVFSVLISGAALVNVLGQLCAGLGLRVVAGTARVWLGVFLFWVTLVGWIFWDFNPWLLGSYAGMAGGALIAVGEWRGLWETDSPPVSP